MGNMGMALTHCGGGGGGAPTWAACVATELCGGGGGGAANRVQQACCSPRERPIKRHSLHNGFPTCLEPEPLPLPPVACVSAGTSFCFAASLDGPLPPPAVPAAVAAAALVSGAQQQSLAGDPSALDAAQQLHMAESLGGGSSSCCATLALSHSASLPLVAPAGSGGGLRDAAGRLLGALGSVRGGGGSGGPLSVTALLARARSMPNLASLSKGQLMQLLLRLWHRQQLRRRLQQEQQQQQPEKQLLPRRHLRRLSSPGVGASAAAAGANAPVNQCLTGGDATAAPVATRLANWPQQQQRVSDVFDGADVLRGAASGHGAAASNPMQPPGPNPLLAAPHVQDEQQLEQLPAPQLPPGRGSSGGEAEGAIEAPPSSAAPMDVYWQSAPSVLCQQEPLPGPMEPDSATLAEQVGRFDLPCDLQLPCGWQGSEDYMLGCNDLELLLDPSSLLDDGCEDQNVQQLDPGVPVAAAAAAGQQDRAPGVGAGAGARAAASSAGYLIDMLV